MAKMFFLGLLSGNFPLIFGFFFTLGLSDFLAFFFLRLKVFLNGLLRLCTHGERAARSSPCSQDCTTPIQNCPLYNTVSFNGFLLPVTPVNILGVYGDGALHGAKEPGWVLFITHIFE